MPYGLGLRCLGFLEALRPLVSARCQASRFQAFQPSGLEAMSASRPRNFTRIRNSTSRTFGFVQMGGVNPRRGLPPCVRHRPDGREPWANQALAQLKLVWPTQCQFGQLRPAVATRGRLAPTWASLANSDQFGQVASALTNLSQLGNFSAAWANADRITPIQTSLTKSDRPKALLTSSTNSAWLARV